ncbi:uncharacterized protein LOC135501175 [Lineus longissimus]|uniref:uncharacterized protein LOC135501175 n=1 Tax=Lineus longissimus TaxID=88925 RepID=UPI002B4F106E
MVNIQTLVFLDLEATGLLSPIHKPKITELTMIAVHCSEFLQAHLGSNMPRIINKLTLCFNPRKAITPKAMEMTGLYSDSLENQSDFDKDAVALIDVFLRRLAPPICFLAHCGNRFDYPLLKTEILNVGSELTADIVCADTWEMFQSLDNRAYIPMAWSRKSVMSHDLATANGVVSSKCDVVTLKQTDNLKKRHSQSSLQSDEKPNSSACNVSPSTSKGKNEDSQKIGCSKSDTKSNNIMNCKPNFLSSNTSLSLLCGGDFKSLTAKRVEHPDSGSAEALCACESPVQDCSETVIRSGGTSPKVECFTNNDGSTSRLCSPYAEGNNNAVFSTKPATKSSSPAGSKISDTKGNGVRKITSFSIKDIVTSDKSDSLSGESSPPAIVSSGLTYRGSSPPALLSTVNSKSPSSPTKTSLMRPGSAKSLDAEVAGVSNENLDSVNNNSDKSSKGEMLLIKGEKSETKGVEPSECGSTGTLGQSAQNSVYVNSGTSENSVAGPNGEKKVQIRKPAKKRFSRGHDALNFDSPDLNSKVDSVKTDASPKSKTPESVSSVNAVPQISSGVSEGVIASTSNSAADHQGRCQTPESNLISASLRSCPRSPTKRKPSDSIEHDNGISQAKKVKKKLFESDSASVRELVHAASNSPGSDSGAEPVSSSQGNNGDAGNNKPRLESLGTIIYWHDYFTEEFFKESLEMEDCLHPKPDSSSSSREAALNMEKRQNLDVKRPQTLSANVDNAVNSNPVAAEHSSAFKPQDSLAANPVLRSALTAPLNLSLKDRDELDVTSSHSNSAQAKSPEHDNQNTSQRLATTPKSHGNTSQREDKAVDILPHAKVSYSQREIYRRVFGIYPPISHRSEDDCITLMQIVQTVAPKAAIWLDVNSCPFRQVEPLYTRK